MKNCLHSNVLKVTEEVAAAHHQRLLKADDDNRHRYDDDDKSVIWPTTFVEFNVTDRRTRLSSQWCNCSFLPVGLIVILSSDWPVVVAGLEQWVGLGEHPGWLSILETLDRPVRSVAVWRETEEVEDNTDLTCDDLPQDDVIQLAFRVLLPSKVWTAVEIWPRSFSEFPLCRLSFCVLRCHRSCYCWRYSRRTSLHTAEKTVCNTDGLTCQLFSRSCRAVRYRCLWLKTGEGAWVVHQSPGSTGRSKQRRCHTHLRWECQTGSKPG